MKLTSVLVIAFIFLFSALGFAQKQSNHCTTKKPLPSKAFNKMIVNDITYAIIGEQTPVSGIKVDVSKPEATVSGVFRTKKSRIPWSMFGFEFKGGITDKNFSLFKGSNAFNTAFEIKPSFYFIPPWNSAKFGTCSIAKSKTEIIDAKNKLVRKYANSVIDSFYAVALIRKRHLGVVADWEKDKFHIPHGDSTTPTQNNLMRYFISKFLKNEDLFKEYDTTYEQIIKVMPEATDVAGEIVANKYIDDVSESYNKYLKYYKNIDEDTLAKMISNASKVWTAKKYGWITISPFMRTEKVNEYYTKYKGADSSYFKSDYLLYYGISGYINSYIIYPNKIAHLIRIGLSYSLLNNLSNLSSFNYETQTPFFAYGNTMTSKTKSGIAYNHDEIKKDIVSSLNLEYYLLPLNTFVPGFYFSTNLNFSNLYRLPKIVNRQDDKFQLALEGGLVFNVNSREKDKERSILSFLFYVRSEDLTDTYRTPISTGIVESNDDFLKRNFSIGIRVGIPVNLPQRD